MFTGIISKLGHLIPGPTLEKLKISVSADFVTNIKVGDSVAINGVCLTVVDFSDSYLYFDLSPETLNRTNFKYLNSDSETINQVNLEKALKLGDNLDGHLVLGHVDTVITVSNIIELNNNNKILTFTINHNNNYLKYIAPKGSVTINGVSLTVNTVEKEKNNFTVNIIPHTLEQTNLKNLVIGSQVNLEIDMFARYSINYLECLEQQNSQRSPDIMFNNISDILADFAVGKMVIILDDESRENEGDLLMAAEKVTAADINFMAKYGRGLICLPLTQERCELLNLPLMVEKANNKSSYGTGFTISIEAATGVTTGISAADRAATIKACVNPDAKPTDLVRPGHIFPIMACDGGVLSRAGHTEAGIDLARLSGCNISAAVLVEIMNDDGTMARRDDLIKFARLHNLKIGTIKDLINYRLSNNI